MAHISAGLEYGLHCLLFLVDPRRDVPPASARDLADCRRVGRVRCQALHQLQRPIWSSPRRGLAAVFGSPARLDSIGVLDVVTAIDGRAAVRAPRGPRPVRAVRGSRPRGDARRLLDTRNHAGRRRECARCWRRTLSPTSPHALDVEAPRDFGEAVAKWLSAQRPAGCRKIIAELAGGERLRATVAVVSSHNAGKAR